MKKLFLFFSIVLMSISFSAAQEWFTNFDIAKRLALIQDKMLFVVWEESLFYRYPIIYYTDKGDIIVVDLSKDDSFDSIIWEHFIPVLLPESEYDKLIVSAKGREAKYLTKLNDDSIKIMDANMNILNVNAPSYYEQNLSALIKTYSLRTTFLKQDLVNYSERKNLTTSFNLGSKYIDFALFVEKEARAEIIELANIYFDEARNYLIKDSLENKVAYSQRIDLLEIKEILILNNARKSKRLLKKMKEKGIDKKNNSLFNFLNYTTFMILKDEKNAALFKDKVSNVNIKKAELILNINN